jgi:hypothetical protein
MQYTFTRDGKEETVEPELWRWEAHYRDGSVLKQFDDNGVFHQFSEIDRGNLAAFKMRHMASAIAPVFVIPFNIPGMKLIHYYMRTGIAVGTPEFVEHKSYVFGYELMGTKHLTVILHNGEVVCCEDPSIISFT